MIFGPTRWRLGALALLQCAAFAGGAAAQEKFPGKPVSLIIPYGPGAASDVVARIVGEGLARQLGQPVVPINRPGGNGIVAIRAAQASPADGYTVMFHASGIVNEQVLRKTTFDVRKDVLPVGRVSVAPLGLFVSSQLPVNSVKDLVDYGRKNPGRLTYASPGIGSVIHLNTERFRMATGLDLLHVPYPAGTAPVLTALIAGDINMYINEMGSMRGVVADKRVKVLATLADDRSPLYPEAPSSAELGVPELRGFTGGFFYGLYVEPGTPADRVETLNRALNKAMEDPAVRERLVGLGYSPATLGGMTQPEFRKLVADELARVETVVREARIPTQQ